MRILEADVRNSAPRSPRLCVVVAARQVLEGSGQAVQPASTEAGGGSECGQGMLSPRLPPLAKKAAWWRLAESLVAPLAQSARSPAIERSSLGGVEALQRAPFCLILLLVLEQNRTSKNIRVSDDDAVKPRLPPSKHKLQNSNTCLLLLFEYLILYFRPTSSLLYSFIV